MLTDSHNHILERGASHTPLVLWCPFNPTTQPNPTSVLMLTFNSNLQFSGKRHLQLPRPMFLPW